MITATALAGSRGRSVRHRAEGLWWALKLPDLSARITHLTLNLIYFRVRVNCPACETSILCPSARPAELTFMIDCVRFWRNRYVSGGVQ